MPLESLFADSYAPKDRGLLALLKSVISDAASTLPPEEGYAAPLQANLEERRPKPPMEFYQQVTQKLGEPQFHSRVLADILRSTDKPIYDAVAGPLALGFSSTPQGMALTQAAGIVGNPSLENIFASAHMLAEPGNAALAASPIAKLHGLQRRAEELATAKGLQNARVNARNEVYHATDLEGFKGILEVGEIRPNEWLHMGLGPKKAKELMKQGGNWQTISKDVLDAGVKDGSIHPLQAELVKANGYKSLNKLTKTAENKWHQLMSQNKDLPHGKEILEEIWDAAQDLSPTNPLSGVSVSRVPRIAPKSSKAISFVIDREAMPPNRPLAEEGYRKTEPNYEQAAWWNHITDQEQAQINEYNLALGQMDQGWSLAEVKTAHPDLPGNINNTVDMAGWVNKQLQTIRETAGSRKKPTSIPNKLFEFEDRTYNTPIPLTGKGGKPVVKEVWVDKSAVNPPDVFSTNPNMQQRLLASPEYKQYVESLPLFYQERLLKPKNKMEADEGTRMFLANFMEANAFTKNFAIDEIRQQAIQAGLPVRVFDSGPQMHAARAGSYGRNPQGLSYGAHETTGIKPPKSSVVEIAPSLPGTPTWWPDYVQADYEAGILTKEEATTKAISHGYSPDNPATLTTAGLKTNWQSQLPPDPEPNLPGDFFFPVDKAIPPVEPINLSAVDKMTSTLKNWLGKQTPVTVPNIKSKTPNVQMPGLAQHGPVEVFDPKTGATKGYVTTEAEAKKFWDAYGWDYSVLAE